MHIGMDRSPEETNKCKDKSEEIGTTLNTRERSMSDQWKVQVGLESYKSSGQSISGTTDMALSGTKSKYGEG
jgi:hypothetical protein